MANDISDALSKMVNNVTVASSLRVPQFNASDPEMWFAVVEAYFSKARVMEEQRYLDVMSSLPPRYASEVRDIIMRHLDNDSCATLKRELIKRLCSTQEGKTLGECGYGGRKIFTVPPSRTDTGRIGCARKPVTDTMDAWSP
jgi:hypothetical protein